MKLARSKKFDKQYKKLPKGVQVQFSERLMLFIDDPSYPLLRTHELTGKYTKCSSINITGDIRAIFQVQTNGTVLFIAIGSHSELYS